MEKWLAGIHFKSIYENTINVWCVIFIVYFLSILIIGIIQHARGKRFWDSSAFVVPAALFFVLFAPIALAFYVAAQAFAYLLSVPIYLIVGAFRLWRRIAGKPQKQSGQRSRAGP